MWWMTRRHLARVVDAGRIAGAVAGWEARTSGEIAISIAPWFWGSVEAAAARAFARLGVDRTVERNGVLLFVVPSRRRFVLQGDEAAHARLGQRFWDETAAALAGELRAGLDLTSAIVRGVERIGAALAEAFPPRGPRTNVLDDAPEFPRR
jgi:uncharacterized membrane protein